MQDIKDALKRYVEKRIPTGGFLQAVLENDLKEAVGRADHININRIPEIVTYIYNEIPSNSWGSHEAVKSWLDGNN